MLRPSRPFWNKLLGSTPGKSTILKSFEARLQRLSEILEPPEPLSQAAQGDLLGTLKEILAQPMNQKSSQAPVESHFQGLFAGLDTLTDLKSPIRLIISSSDDEKIRYIKENCRTEEQLVAVLDELYYHRKLSRKVAAYILKREQVTSVAPFMKIINGGNLLKWPLSVKHIFSLQLSNKCYELKDISTSKALILDNFDTAWAPLLHSTELHHSVVFGLGRALFILNGEHVLVPLVNGWNQETFQSISLSKSKVIYPLIKAAVQLSGKANTYLALRALIAAHHRISDEKDAASLFIACLEKIMSYSAEIHDPAHALPFKKELLECIDLLITKPNPNHWDVDLMNILLSICQAAPQSLSQNLLPGLEDYVHSHYEHRDEDVWVALMYHKLALAKA